MDSVRSGCLKLLRPNELCIDEQVVPFQGRCNFKQFVRGKQNPVGFKIFALANKDGLVFDFFLYQGKRSTITTEFGNLSLAESVVKLCETVPPRSSVFFDRYFTSEKLMNALLMKKNLWHGNTSN